MTPNRVPGPLGFCARCIAGGHRKTAIALVEGTGLCDPCTLDEMHVHGDEAAAALHSLRVQDQSEGLGG